MCHQKLSSFQRSERSSVEVLGVGGQGTVYLCHKRTAALPLRCGHVGSPKWGDVFHGETTLDPSCWGSSKLEATCFRPWGRSLKLMGEISRETSREKVDPNA